MKKKTGEIKPVNPRDLYNNNTLSLLCISASMNIVIIENAGLTRAPADGYLRRPKGASS